MEIHLDAKFPIQKEIYTGIEVLQPGITIMIPLI